MPEVRWVTTRRTRSSTKPPSRCLDTTAEYLERLCWVDAESPRSADPRVCATRANERAAGPRKPEI